jgi:hypothetical protein
MPPLVAVVAVRNVRHPERDVPVSVLTGFRFFNRQGSALNQLSCYARHRDESGRSGKRLQFFPGFETDGLAGQDVNLGTRARVSSDSGLARLHVEDAESTQLYPLSLGQGLLHRTKYSFDGNLSFGLRDSGTVDDIIDKIELNQKEPPENTGFHRKKPLRHCQVVFSCIMMRCSDSF